MKKNSTSQKHAHLRHKHYHYHYGLLHYPGLFFLEIMMAVLVVIGLATFFYSYIASPTVELQSILDRVSVVIGLLLLFEFFGRLLLSKHKPLYLKYNWWYLLASMPIATPAASALRAVRLLGFVKMIKIGIHLRLDENLLKEIDNKRT